MENALQRIEAALTRLERVSAQETPEDGDLAERHERLRTAVQRSLAQLDDLLADGEA